ncbi:MAG: alpha/beta fold hydrolase [Planctomycetes bacterium]|nr:alpha/beta fold hydrolase [Planctomycetota bacterium]
MNAVGFALPVSRTRTLRGDLELPPEEDWPAPVVIFCHGFKGFKEWGAWPWLTRTLAARGFAVARFNFSLCGVSGDGDRHDEPEKFAVNTYSAELEDLARLVDSLPHLGAPPGSLAAEIGILGHSRGGMISLLFASARSDVLAIATLAAPADAERYDAATMAQWRRAGRLPVLNHRTGQELYLSVTVLDDYDANRGRYDVAAAISRRRVPTLVIHGERDETVPVSHATRIHNAASHEDKKLVLLPRTGHTFGAAHPFAGTTPELEIAANEVAFWFGRYLRS